MAWNNVVTHAVYGNYMGDSFYAGGWNFVGFSPCTRPLKEALARQSGGGYFSGTGSVSEPSQRTWIQRAEPSHLIITGVIGTVIFSLIAVGGLVWQKIRSPSDSLTSITAPITAQIPRIAPEPPRPDVKRYTPYEKEQRLRAVDEIYGVITAKLSPAYTEGQTLFHAVQSGDADIRCQQS